jgi:hypothetical protein
MYDLKVTSANLKKLQEIRLMSGSTPEMKLPPLFEDATVYI